MNVVYPSGDSDSCAHCGHEHLLQAVGARGLGCHECDCEHGWNWVVPPRSLKDVASERALTTVEKSYLSANLNVEILRARAEHLSRLERAWRWSLLMPVALGSACWWLAVNGSWFMLGLNFLAGLGLSMSLIRLRRAIYELRERAPRTGRAPRDRRTLRCRLLGCRIHTGCTNGDSCPRCDCGVGTCIWCDQPELPTARALKQ